jgi:hypothetical protein
VTSGPFCLRRPSGRGRGGASNAALGSPGLQRTSGRQPFGGARRWGRAIRSAPEGIANGCAKGSQGLPGAIGMSARRGTPTKVRVRSRIRPDAVVNPPCAAGTASGIQATEGGWRRRRAGSPNRIRRGRHPGRRADRLLLKRSPNRWTTIVHPFLASAFSQLLSSLPAVAVTREGGRLLWAPPRHGGLFSGLHPRLKLPHHLARQASGIARECSSSSLPRRELAWRRGQCMGGPWRSPDSLESAH